MSSAKLVVANFKTSGSVKFFKSYLSALGAQSQQKHKLVLCPSFPYFYLFQEDISRLPGVCLGAQDSSLSDKSVITGDVTAAMLKEYGVKYALVGHSERCIFLNETPSIVKKKLERLLKEGIRPILCLGEPKEIKEKAQTAGYLEKRLENILSPVVKKIILAYEPLWAIGTDIRPSLEEVRSVVRHLRSFLSLRSIEGKILYGGSVDSSNAKELLESQDLDGILIGRASLDVNEILKVLA